MILDPLYGPYRTGNGRLLVTGEVSEGENIRVTVWPIDGARPFEDAPTQLIASGPPGPPGRFSAWIVGPHPTLFEESHQPDEWVLDSLTGLWEAPWSDPLFVTVGQTICTEEVDPTTQPYSYMRTGDVVSVNTNGEPPSTITLTTEGSLRTGQTYRIVIEGHGGDDWEVIFDEQVRWDCSLRDLRTVWRESYTPGWAQTSPNNMLVQDALARRHEDVYSWCEDVEMQAHPLTASWTLGLWEQALGLPPSGALPMATRRALVMARKLPGSISRTTFMDGLIAIVGTATIEDLWEDLEVNIHMPPDMPAALIALAERYVEEMKPAGIKVTIGYTGGFQLDVSELDLTFL